MYLKICTYFRKKWKLKICKKLKVVSEFRIRLDTFYFKALTKYEQFQFQNQSHGFNVMLNH